MSENPSSTGNDSHDKSPVTEAKKSKAEAKQEKVAEPAAKTSTAAVDLLKDPDLQEKTTSEAATSAANTLKEQQADLEIATATAKRDVSVQVADATRDDAILKAQLEHEAKSTPKTDAETKLGEAKGEVGAAVTRAKPFKDEVGNAKKDLVTATNENDAAVKAQLATKIKLDGATTRVKDALAAQAITDKAVEEANKAQAVAAAAFSKASAEEAVAKTNLDTVTLKANQQYEVDKATAESELATAISAATAKKVEVWRNAKKSP